MTPTTGLTASQVAKRLALGQVNYVELETSRPLAALVRANVFTRFNALLGGLLVVILIVGPLQDALFGVILVANTAIGIIQEWRAKRTLDRLAVVTAPTARVLRGGALQDIPAREVVLDDVLELHSGDQVVVDALVVTSEGLEVDESMLTGESEPAHKAPGQTVLSGSAVVSGAGRCQATAVGPDAYGARLATEARRFTLFRSELRTGTDRLLRGITWVMLPVGVLLAWSQLSRTTNLQDALRGSVAGTVTMVPEGFVLLTNMAFAAGVLRLARRRVLVQELPAIEGLARVDTLCIDKTGTLTTGALHLCEVRPLAAGLAVETAQAALAALAAADQAPNATSHALRDASSAPPTWTVKQRWPFSSARKWSGADFGSDGTWLLGAPEVLTDDVAISAQATRLAEQGHRVLLLAQAVSPDPVAGCHPAALISLTDELREDAGSTIDFLRDQGVRVIVLSGDHPATVGAVAASLRLDGAARSTDARSLLDDDALGVALQDHSVFGRVTPQQKQTAVRLLQGQGHVVSMIGDGVNDALALKDADLGIAMGSGAAATRAVAQLVLLDSEFGAVPQVVREGRQVIANVERVGNLFLTKTVYATVLALCVGVARLPFPFLPRQLTLVSALTIGIPGFFLALSPNTRRWRRGFLGRILRFAVPAGVVAAGATFLAYRLARDEPGTDLATARTLATVVLFGVALWVLVLLARPATRPRQWLIATMVASFLLAMALPATREFFALSVPRPLVWLAGVGVAAIAGLGLELGQRASAAVGGWFSSHRSRRGASA